MSRARPPEGPPVSRVSAAAFPPRAPQIPDGTRVLLLPWPVSAPLEIVSPHDPDLRLWCVPEADGLIRMMHIAPGAVRRVMLATDHGERMDRSVIVLYVETARAKLTRKWATNGHPVKFLDEPIPQPPGSP